MKSHGLAIEELLKRQQPISRGKFVKVILPTLAIGGAWAWYNGLFGAVGDTFNKIIDKKEEFEIVLADRKVLLDKKAYGLEDCTTKNDGYKFVGYAKFGDNWWDLYDATAQDPNAISLISRVGKDCNDKQIGRGVLNNDASKLFHYMRPLYDDRQPINLEQIAKEGGHKLFTVERFPNSISPEYKHIHHGKHYLVPVPHTGPPIDTL